MKSLLLLIWLFYTYQSKSKIKISESSDVNFHISLQKDKISEATGVLFLGHISSSNNNFKIPTVPSIGFPDDPFTDIYFEVQKEEGVTFKICKSKISYEHFPGDKDSSKNKFINSVSFKFDLFYYFDFYKGEYRIRLVYYASKFNKIKDVKSNWVYFTIHKNLIHK